MPLNSGSSHVWWLLALGLLFLLSVILILGFGCHLWCWRRRHLPAPAHVTPTPVTPLPPPTSAPATTPTQVASLPWEDATPIQYRGLTLTRPLWRYGHSYKLGLGTGAPRVTTAIPPWPVDIRGTNAAHWDAIHMEVHNIRVGHLAVALWWMANIGAQPTSMLPQRLLVHAEDSNTSWPPLDATTRRLASTGTTAQFLALSAATPPSADSIIKYTSAWDGHDGMVMMPRTGGGHFMLPSTSTNLSIQTYGYPQDSFATREEFVYGPAPMPFVGHVAASVPLEVSGTMFATGTPTRIWSDWAYNTIPNVVLDPPTIMSLYFELLPATKTVPLLGPQYCMTTAENPDNGLESPCEHGPIVAVAPKIPFRLSVNAAAQAVQANLSGLDVEKAAFLDREDLRVSAKFFTLTLALPAIPNTQRNVLYIDSTKTVPYVWQALVVVENLQPDTSVQVQIRTANQGLAWQSLVVDRAKASAGFPVHALATAGTPEAAKVLFQTQRVGPSTVPDPPILAYAHDTAGRSHAILPLYFPCTVATAPTAVRIVTDRCMMVMRTWLHVHGVFRPGYEAGLPPQLTARPGTIGLQAYHVLPFSMDMTCQPPTTGGGTWEWSQPLPRVPASAHDQYGVVLQLACTFQFETGVSQLWLELDLADGSTAMLTAKPITDQSPPGSESHRQAFVNELQVQAWAPAHPSDPKPQLCDSAYKLQANGTLLFPVLRIAPGTLPALPVAVRVRLSQPHGHAQYAVVLAVQGEMTPGEVFLQQASP